MKTLPRWALAVVVFAIIALVLAVVSRFATKSLVYARGLVKVEASLEEKARGIKTLFMILYDLDSPNPMPYGAARFRLSDDPRGEFFHFALTRENLQLMNPNSEKLPSKLRLKARLDRDGSAGADQSGDLTGEVSTLELGQENVELIISKFIK